MVSFLATKKDLTRGSNCFDPFGSTSLNLVSMSNLWCLKLHVELPFLLVIRSANEEKKMDLQSTPISFVFCVQVTSYLEIEVEFAVHLESSRAVAHTREYNVQNVFGTDFRGQLIQILPNVLVSQLHSCL